MIALPDCFIRFEADTSGYALPERFTFPFHYTPHPLSLLAAAELQAYLHTQQDWQHDFGLDADDAGLGKMFGPTIVQVVVLATTAGEPCGDDGRTGQPFSAMSSSSCPN